MLHQVFPQMVLNEVSPGQRTLCAPSSARPCRRAGGQGERPSADSFAFETPRPSCQPQVVKQWRSTPWSIHSGAGSVGDAAAVAGTASASAKLGTLRIGVLPHSTVGRLCGKRRLPVVSPTPWRRPPHRGTPPA